MEVSTVDLRYRSKDILNALERNETVTILYHGKVKGIIKPPKSKKKLKVMDSPFFGMYQAEENNVQMALDELRKPRSDL